MYHYVAKRQVLAAANAATGLRWLLLLSFFFPFLLAHGVPSACSTDSLLLQLLAAVLLSIQCSFS